MAEDARFNWHAGRGHPDPSATPWYVTDPSTGLLQTSTSIAQYAFQTEDGFAV